MKLSAKSIAVGGLIAALYVVLTLVSGIFGLSGVAGPVQIRISEALCILPVFTPAAVPGLFVGCIISNLILGGSIWDIAFGSIATLIGAVGTYLLRKHRFLAPLPPIVSNMIIVPIVLMLSMGTKESFWVLMLCVGIGEFISAGIIGEILYIPLNKYRSLLR